MKAAGLVVLLERSGGRVSYSEAEYQAIAARYGGTASLAIHMEVAKTGDNPPVVELTLISKAPKNAELVS